MKIVKYELSLVQKKELILTMEDNVDSENLLKIFLETQVKEEKEQDGLIGIIAEKVSEESCTEQCESCQKYCPASEECMATDENVRCTECEYLCKTCGRCELKEEKDFGHDCRCNDNSSKHGNQDAGICSCLHGVDVTLFSSVPQHGLRPAVGVNKEHDI